MPTPMQRSGFSSLLYPGLNEAYLLAFNEYPEEFSRVLNMESSARYSEEDVKLAGFGLAQEKVEGSQPYYDFLDISNKKTYVHKTYALGYEVTEEAREDELYGIFKQASRVLATSVRHTLEVLGAAPWNNAFNSAYAGVDGLELCSTVHPQSKAGGTVANKPAIDCDFDPVALQAALYAWETLTNDNALPLMLKPKYIISGPQQRDIITRTLGSSGYPGTNDNDINSLKDWNLEKIIMHYLTDPDAWFIATRPSDHFVKWFWRVRPMFRSFDDVNTGNARFYVRFRQSVGFTHWWGIYGTQGG